MHNKLGSCPKIVSGYVLVKQYNQTEAFSSHILNCFRLAAARAHCSVYSSHVCDTIKSLK